MRSVQFEDSVRDALEWGEGGGGGREGGRGGGEGAIQKCMRKGGDNLDML